MRQSSQKPSRTYSGCALTGWPAAAAAASSASFSANSSATSGDSNGTTPERTVSFSAKGRAHFMQARARERRFQSMRAIGATSDE